MDQAPRPGLLHRIIVNAEFDLAPRRSDIARTFGGTQGPKQPNGMMTRWSRPSFDWRNEQRVTVRKIEA